jgi:hypothetical protein
MDMERVRALFLGLLLLGSCGTQDGKEHQEPGEVSSEIAIRADIPELDALADWTADVFRQPDGMNDIPLTDLVLETTNPASPGKVLLLDFEMRHPLSWAFAVEQLEALGHTVSYRRFFPHVTELDVVDGDNGELPYELIIVSTGNAPGEPSARMREKDAWRLQSYLEQGGTVLFLNRHTWQDGFGGDSEWFYFNRVLAALDVPLRISRNTAIGFVSMQNGDLPPLHASHPAAYPGSLEWTLSYPVGYSETGHPAMPENELSFAAGVTSTVHCDGDDVAVFAWTHQNVLLWQFLDSGNPEAVFIPLVRQPLAALAPAGDNGGYVAVVPRSWLQLPVHTEYMSDKPILDLSLLDNSETIASAILTHVSNVARDGGAHEPQGCSAVPDEGLLQPTATGFDVYQDGPLVSAQYPPSELPVAEAPPEPPDGAPGLSAVLATTVPEPVALPDWYHNGRAHLGYGGMKPYDQMKDSFTNAMANGMDAFVITVDSNWLISYDNGEIEGAPPFANVANAAAETGATLFLGVNFLTGVYGKLAESIGSATGPLGESINAPPPLADAYWEQAIVPIFRGAAKAARDFPGITGVHMDMELYGAGMLWYPQGMMFDDDTWQRAVDAIGKVDAQLAEAAGQLELTKRLPWLVDSGLVGTVFKALEDETTLRVAAMREEVRAIHEPLELAFYGVQLSTAWYYLGWLKGLGTAERPVTHLTYDIATNRARHLLASEGAHARILGGCLGVRFTPEDLDKALVGAGSRSDGYWLFQYTDFPWPPVPGTEAKVHGSVEDFWLAIKSANGQLDTLDSPE